jgi:hypothetical protein
MTTDSRTWDRIMLTLNVIFLVLAVVYLVRTWL